MADDSASPRQVHRLHLEVLGSERSLALPMRDGPCNATELLPPARAIAHAVVETATAQARARGQTVSCGPACGACCRQLVPISLIEARALAAAIDALPSDERAAKRARFEDAVRRLEAAGLLARGGERPRVALVGEGSTPAEAWRDVSTRYFAAQIPCPLLEQESCSMHADRPLVCREYNVVSPPERCARLDGGAETLPRPLHLGEALAEVARELEPHEAFQIPLALCLEWADASPHAFETTYDADRLLEMLVGALAREDDATAGADS